MGLPIDKIYCLNCLEGMKLIDDKFIDFIVTDPPYGLNFMGKDWDRAIPSVDIWKECLRILKSGGFAFVMCIPRQDCLSHMIINLSNAGFDTGFTSIYWAYASGFPKAGNIGRMVDKRLGIEREVIGKEMVDIGMQSGTMHAGRPVNVVERDKTIATSDQAKALDGSYTGFQPKPAVEIIIVAMKPLSEKTYVDQALKNKKGITWLDDCRVPYKSGDDAYEKGIKRSKSPKTDIRGGGFHACNEKGYSDNIIESGMSSQGRFPANLLVSDDVLNDGKVTKSEGGQSGVISSGETYSKGWKQNYNIKGCGFGDIGSFSRYFDLDAWWQERFKKLPEDVQKVFPFLIVPKASKSEKDKGMSKMPIVHAPIYNYEGRDLSNPKNVLSPGMQNRMARNIHPTCKPVALMSYLIIMGSREGDIILDPFIGSGTTAISARLSNRHYIGFEISGEYCEIANARLRSIPVSLDSFVGS